MSPLSSFWPCAGSLPPGRDFYTGSMATTAIRGWQARPRDFLAVRGPDASDFVQRLLSNDVAALAPGQGCDALLLTPKARLIASLRVLCRDETDFLLLTEPGLGEVVRNQLLRARFAAKVEVELEQHESAVVVGTEPAGERLAAPEYGAAAWEVLDERPPGDPLEPDDLERLRIEALGPAWGRELDDRVLPAEAGLVERAVSLNKGCFPGQEPIARLHYRGHVNRRLRRLRIDGATLPEYDAELRNGERAVGRVTSAVVIEDGVVLALAYVRTDVTEDAELTVVGRSARLA
jgi:tRNA-modifying protein YgfZ